MLNKKKTAIIWNIVILFLCLVNLSKIDEVQKVDIPYMDKAVHFIFYTISSFLWLRALLNPGSLKRVTIIKVVCGLVLFGLTVELLQGAFTTQRSFEWMDVLSNTLGVLFGTTVHLLYIKQKPHN